MSREQTAEEVTLLTGLGEAARSDGTGSFRDEALLGLPAIARRITPIAKDHPDPIRAAADREGGEKERTLRTSRTAIRPLADAYSKEA